MDPGNAYQILATMAYSKIKYLIEQTVASGLIYLNSNASDFENPELRPYVDRYMRGSTEEIRRYCLFGAMASGNADRFKGFAEDCMNEYDLNGWKVPDLSDPGEFSHHVKKK